MQAHNYKPVTRRCVYCRPSWTWGVRRWSRLGRLYDFIWPPHVIGKDYGPPYTDGLCEKAERRELARIRRKIFFSRAHVTEIVLALFLAGLIAQHVYIRKQSQRLQNLREIVISIVLDSRDQWGNHTHGPIRP